MKRTADFLLPIAIVACALWGIASILVFIGEQVAA